MSEEIEDNGETQMFKKEHNVLYSLWRMTMKRVELLVVTVLLGGGMTVFHGVENKNVETKSLETKAASTNAVHGILWDETGKHFGDLLDLIRQLQAEQMVLVQSNRATSIENRKRIVELETRVNELEQQMKGKTNVSTNN